MKYSMLLLLILGLNCIAQQVPPAKTEYISYLSKKLSVSNDTARLVVKILDRYKGDLKKTALNATLSEEKKGAEMRVLLNKRYKELQTLLNSDQLSKIGVQSDKRPPVKPVMEVYDEQDSK